jgi:hypothetical protein
MPIGAVVGAAVVGGGASVIAANKNSSAIEKSTDTSLQANREAIAAQERAFQQQLAFQSDALNQNLAMQADTYNSSGQTQAAIYNNNVGTLNPFVQTGYSAMNSINSLIGLPKQKAYNPKEVAFTPVEARQVTAIQPAPPAPIPDTRTNIPYNYGGY